MTRIVVVDDHPAVRAGVQAIVEACPDLEFAGAGDGRDGELWPLLATSRPDLVLLDYHLPRTDGLRVCYTIKHSLPAIKVVLYTAYSGPALTLPALIVGADGIVEKRAAAAELIAATARAMDGGRQLPAVTRRDVEAACAGMIGRHRAVVQLLAAGVHEDELARRLGRSREDVREAVYEIIGAIRPMVRTDDRVWR
ncbi:MAG TPA: response regulator transcription factor [Solirubrobacteraceae bacterium]|nr:response regulator transcription factor [Solirubrobacteraceae bacterium]